MHIAFHIFPCFFPDHEKFKSLCERSDVFQSVTCCSDPNSFFVATLWKTTSHNFFTTSRGVCWTNFGRFTGNLDPSILKAGFAGMELDVTWIPFEDPQGFVLWMILRSFSLEVFKISICHRSSKLWPRIL